MNSPWQQSGSTDGILLAQRFVATYFPNCEAAWVGGSVGRGTPGPNSDLDLLVVQNHDSAYRMLRTQTWEIGAMVTSHASILESLRRGNAAAAIHTNGVQIVSRNQRAEAIRDELGELLDIGPLGCTGPVEELAYYANHKGYRDHEFQSLAGRMEHLEDPHHPADKRLICAAGIVSDTLDLWQNDSNLWAGPGKIALANLESVEPSLAATLHPALTSMANGDCKPLGLWMRKVAASRHRPWEPRTNGGHTPCSYQIESPQERRNIVRSLQAIATHLKGASPSELAFLPLNLATNLAALPLYGEVYYQLEDCLHHFYSEGDPTPLTTAADGVVEYFADEVWDPWDWTPMERSRLTSNPKGRTL